MPVTWRAKVTHCRYGEDEDERDCSDRAVVCVGRAKTGLATLNDNAAHKQAVTAFITQIPYALLFL